jgi:hypothetical protein
LDKKYLFKNSGVICQTLKVSKTFRVSYPTLLRRYNKNDSKAQAILFPITPIFQKSYLTWFALNLILILIFISLPQSVHSQESPITASVNKTDLPSDELVILTVIVVDDSAQQPRPILPRLDGLAVIDLDISTNVSVIKSKIHTEVTYVYRLQPRRTGLLTIPPVSVKIDDKIYKTPPISINVRPGAAPVPSPGNEARPENISPPPDFQGQDFFVESQVNLLTPYVSQQIIHTFRFYQAIQLYQEPQYEGPRFTGFETMGLPVREYNLDIAGRTYLITEIRTALFPKNPGNTTIGPGQLILLGNFYEEPFEMYTGPVTVKVQSLPNNAPPGFKGAVGQYEIKAWSSPQVAIIHQPASFYVAVSGTGNIHTLPEPVWPELSSWRVYNTLTSLTADTREDGLVSGTRVFERLIVPDQIGDFTIPPATLVYFDPVAAEYRTITTNPLEVKVIPQPTPSPATATAIAILPTATPETRVIEKADINPPAPDEDQVNRILLDSLNPSLGLVLPAFAILLLGMCGLIPLAAAAGAGGFWLWQRRRSKSEVRTGVDTLQQPSQKTHPVLAAAMQKNNDNYRAVSQALSTYLEARLKIPIIGLTRTELAHRLHEHGLDENLIERIKNCFAQSEMGRYGPIIEDAGWSLMAETDELLFELDEMFERG